MDIKLREALRNIIEYLYSDERKDYESYEENEKPQHHIFNDLETIKAHVDAAELAVICYCPDYKFELGTPAILEEDGEVVSGEVVLRDGVKCLSLYSDSNYAGPSERIRIPKDWNNVRKFGNGS